MKKQLVLGVVLGFCFSGFAQVKRAYDPDDSIKVEKAAVGAVSTAPWHWQGVDADFGVLPGAMHVYKTADSLDGRPQVAYYVSVPLKDRSVAGPQRLLRGSSRRRSSRN